MRVCVFICCYIHTYIHNHSFHSINMATSYYPLGSAAAKKAYQAVIGITGVERSNNLTSQLANAIKRNDNLFVKDIGYDDKIPKKKFRQSYSDYTPKGIFKKNWFEKHTLEIPALLLLVLPFEASLSDKEWEEKEIQLVKDIQRGENQVDGSKTKLMLILIQEREYLKSQEGRERAQIAKERVLSLRRCVDFDSKRVHLVYTADLSNENSSADMQKLSKTLHSSCIDFYKKASKSVKDMRRFISTSGMSKEVQYCMSSRLFIKIGHYYELRREDVKAYKTYKDAYDDLISIINQKKQKPSNPNIYNSSKVTINEVKHVAEIICYKLCRLCFLQGRAVEAVRLFRNHMHQLRDLPIIKEGNNSNSDQLKNTIVQCEKKAWATRQCVNIASFLHGYQNILTEQQKTYEYLQESTFIFMAISYERQRRMILNEYLNDNTNSGNEKTSLELDGNIKIIKSDYIGGTDIVTGTKDKAIIQTTILNALLAKHLNPTFKVNMLEYLTRLKRSRLAEGQTSNIRKTIILQLMMCEEYIVAAKKKKKQPQDVKYYEKAYGLIKECIQTFKNDGWRELFIRSLRVAKACTEENEQYDNEYIKHCLDLLLPSNNLKEEERVQLHQNILNKSKNTSVEYRMNHEQNPTFAPYLLEFKVRFSKNCLLVKDPGNIVLSIKSNFPQTIELNSVELVLNKFYSKSSSNNDDIDDISEKTISCRINNNENEVKDDGGNSNSVIDLKEKNLSFKSNETKLFVIPIVEHELLLGDVVLSEKSITCKAMDGMTLIFTRNKHDNKINVNQSPGGTIAKVENNKKNFIFTNKNIEKMDYEELTRKNKREDLQKGVFSLFKPKATMQQEVESKDADVEKSIDASSSLDLTSIYITNPESCIMISTKSELPLLIGEWHPIHFNLKIPNDTLPEDVPSNISAILSMNFSDNDAVVLDVDTKCYLVANGVYKLLDKVEGVMDGEEISNLMYDSTQDKKDYKFKISIENDESNVYEIIVYIYITTSDNNNYYSLINMDSLLHLEMNIQHLSTRCVSTLNKQHKCDLKFENPMKMDMSIISLNPELLPPLISNDKLKLLSGSKSSENSDGIDGEIFRLVKSQRALVHYVLKCASVHALNIHRVEYIPNKSARNISPNENNLDYSTSNLLKLKPQDVQSNCFGLQPIKDGSSVSLGKIAVTWSRLKSLLNPEEANDEASIKQEMCQTAFVLPPTLVYPLQGISVDLKTSTDIAFYCKPFELKLYLINNTVSSERISLELAPNENFLCAGRTTAVLNIQPMSTIVVTYILTGIEIGLLLLPQIEIKSLKSGKYLIDYGKNNKSKRYLYVKPA